MSITRELHKEDVFNAYYVVVRSNKLDEHITRTNLKIITPSEQSKKSVVAFSRILSM